MQNPTKRFALFDTAQAGEYEDDIIRYDNFTDEEAVRRNANLREHGSDWRWVEDKREPEGDDVPDDSPSLEDMGYEAIPAP